MNEKNQKNKETESVKLDPNKPIVLKAPEPTRRQKIWYALTFWRPLFKFEGRKFSTMLLKTSEMILNLDRVQQILIKNNNLMLQQMQGKQVADEMAKEDGERTGEAYL